MAFVINPLRPGAIRLLSVADLAHATEAWIDQIDWARLRGRYARLLRALHVLHDLVPATRRSGIARTGGSSGRRGPCLCDRFGS